MNKKQYQLGSIHLIVIIILVIALLGALGFIFWDKFSSDKDDDKKTTTTSATTTVAEIELTEIAYDSTRGSNLAIKYPSNWTNVHTDGDPTSELPTADINKITSPDGNVAVGLVVGLEGIGGTCYGVNEEIISLNTYEIGNFPSKMLATYIALDHESGNYYYFANVIEKANAQQLSVGGKECELSSLGFMGSMDGVVGATKLGISFPNMENYVFTTLTEATEAMNTENFNIAIQIVQSFYVK